jgi:uncharacterized cupin superfamily protein
MNETEHGLVPADDGWFVVNLADAAGVRSPRLGAYIPLESREHRFPQFGINVHVVEPGQPNGMYHAEDSQEAFLVLHGECILVIEEEERHLRQWDFVHCPPGTNHIFVGAGSGPCAILMVGTRDASHRIHYPVSEVAGRHGASAPVATDDSKQAYEHLPTELTPEHLGWPPA